LEELARTRQLRPEQAAELTRVNFARLFLGQ
jgi:hypothetical protein